MFWEEGTYIMEKLHTVFYQAFQDCRWQIVGFGWAAIKLREERNTVKIRWDKTTRALFRAVCLTKQVFRSNNNNNNKNNNNNL